MFVWSGSKREREGETLFFQSEREATLKGDSCGSRWAPRGLVLREKLAYWGGEGWGVLFILTLSTQSLTQASQLRSCSSSATVYIMKQYCAHQIQILKMLGNLFLHVQCATTTDSQGDEGENTSVDLCVLFGAQKKITPWNIQITLAPFYYHSKKDGFEKY